MDRDTALVVDAAAAAKLIAVDGLLALNERADGTTPDVTVDDLLLAAHQWVYDRLRRKWSAAQLATITNPEPLAAAEAWRFAEVASAQGLIGGDSEGTRAADEGSRTYFGEQAVEAVDGWRPEFPEADSPRASADGIPRMKNITSTTRGSFFYPNLGST